MKTMEDLRFPVGHLEFSGEVSGEQIRAWIDEIADAPARLREFVKDLTAAQLDPPYRPGGWTARQVVHHLADSHMNSYVRFRLALTENEPVIKAYAEELWAELPDALSGPVEPSLDLLEALHDRWVQLLKVLSPADWARTFRHPERGVSRLDETLGLYAWHGRHHIAQIASVRK